ncbi:hypothetical protein QBC37DRAFT_445375 [Rhypophila decipiens]|uniref:Cyanovirin-N domain-containing protein n=1 Tax=Rhypophila decipiens TaxID=261697 RepID=A0AAN7BE93_9PEZI|nr:hypothetical protein QBC37DRAFT_445375 [Rhypophila decipiens]
MQFLNLALLMASASAVLASPVATPAPAAAAAAAPAPGFLDLVPESTSSGSLSKRSFVGSCRNCQIAPYPSQRTQDLSCDCRNERGDYIMAYLNLDTCYINSNGTPKLKKNGNPTFSSGCHWTNKGKQVEGSKSWMVESECSRNGNEWIRSTWDLNNNIHNSNGKLRCDAA